jgi:hypothetical protein
MKKLNYFNILIDNIFDSTNQSYNIFEDVLFGDDWNIFALLQFEMEENYF